MAKGRPRMPLAKARATGSLEKYPKNYANRAEPKTPPLGDPPAWMNKHEVAAWESFKREIPWLNESDRIIVETASTIRAKFLAGERPSAAAIQMLIRCATLMGATPVDRSKIAVPEGMDFDDPAERYFN